MYLVSYNAEENFTNFELSKMYISFCLSLWHAEEAQSHVVYYSWTFHFKASSGNLKEMPKIYYIYYKFHNTKKK